MNKDSVIYVAGHNGLLGSAIVRELKRREYSNIVSISHKDLDLVYSANVDWFFKLKRPNVVFNCAAKVGGIFENQSFPADFIYQNITIATNVIEACRKYGAKLLNLGSSCIYPKHAPQPIKEEYLLSSPLEPTNEAYAIAKIAALKMCRYYNEQFGTNFLSVMPCNLYGEGDQSTHVVPELIRKIKRAKELDVPFIASGTGKPLREFLHADDCAMACILLMERYNAADIGECCNVGSGEEISIAGLVEAIAANVGYNNIQWDSTAPDGTPRKLLDCTKLKALLPDWKPQIGLIEGLRRIL